MTLVMLTWAVMVEILKPGTLMHWPTRESGLAGSTPHRFVHPLERCYFPGTTTTLQGWVSREASRVILDMKDICLTGLSRFLNCFDRQVIILPSLENGILDWNQGTILNKKGFTRSFVTLRGAANHYNDQGLFKETPKSLYTEDGQVAQWPKEAYSTDLYTDKLIEFISEAEKMDQPFFAFAAYTSPHWPLQVDDKLLAKI